MAYLAARKKRRILFSFFVVLSVLNKNEMEGGTPLKTKTGFKVPDRSAREKAAGLQKANNNPKLRKVLSMAETDLCGTEDYHIFHPIHQPEPGDWLADVKEKGQSAAAYIDILTR